MAAVVDTDRVRLKKQRAGIAVPTAIPEAIANQCDEETFTFEVGSDASIVEMGLKPGKKCKVVRAAFTPTTALAAHASAYITIVISKRDGAGGAAVVVATMDTATGGLNVSLAAFVPYDFTISTVAGAATLAATNILTAKSTETGAPATPIGKITVTVEYV